ncbi:MAG: hypothetical protein HYV41_04555 [Candidatus Magasanikbacteria bacterium]|nr:hypothetical protein [Candidatus Magasanikbacteria bacterium]
MSEEKKMGNKIREWVTATVAFTLVSGTLAEGLLTLITDGPDLTVWAIATTIITTAVAYHVFFKKKTV